MIEFIGVLGSIFLGICAVPETIYSVKNKKCRVPTGLLGLWFSGEILLIIYVLAKGDFILTFNYLCNIILLSPIVYYWVKEKRDV